MPTNHGGSVGREFVVYPFGVNTDKKGSISDRTTVGTSSVSIPFNEEITSVFQFFRGHSISGIGLNFNSQFYHHKFRGDRCTWQTQK